MLGHSMIPGRGHINGLIAASWPASRLPDGQHSQADMPAAIKQPPSRDFGTSIDVPQPSHITRALLSVIF
jgi:hypothetical protein